MRKRRVHMHDLIVGYLKPTLLHASLLGIPYNACSNASMCVFRHFSDGFSHTEEELDSLKYAFPSS